MNKFRTVRTVYHSKKLIAQVCNYRALALIVYDIDIYEGTQTSISRGHLHDSPIVAYCLFITGACVRKRNAQSYVS